MARILLAEDDPNLGRVLGYHLERAGHRVVVAQDGLKALALLESSAFDLLVTDVRMPGMDGISLVAKAREAQPDAPALVLTAFGTIQDAVEAMRAGAFDYLTKPVEKETLLRAVDKALRLGDLQRENRRLKASLARERPLDAMLGTSPALLATKELLQKAGPAEATVLLTGESGTGKELAAGALHTLSGRSARPFVAVNCAALPSDLLESELFGHVRGAFTGATADHPGKFVRAAGGTLFLDEVGDMEPRLQAKILRVLQERAVDPVGGTKPVPVDIRLVAATNRNLAAEVRAGRFREDLFYRLNVIAIALPPLRERGEDILLLFQHFYRHFGGGEVGLDDATRATLLAHTWPGNVRELMNLCQRLAVLHPRQPFTAALYAPTPSEPTGSGLPESAPVPEGLWELERAAVLKALEDAGGNKSAAARTLKIPRHVLLYRIKKFGIE
jgi:two-component system NtrC family response regulator